MNKDVLKRLRKFVPHVLKAQDDNLNEADTLVRIMKLFEVVLGYDSLSEISREAQVKDRFVDLAIKSDGVVRFLVEAKAAGATLRDRHIEQAQRYASEGNLRWVVLTNGVNWTLYHLTFEQGIEYTKAFSIDLRNDPIEQCAEKLALLERKHVHGGGLEEFWTHQVALSPSSIARALFTGDVLGVIRREIRRHEEILIDPEDLAVAIHEMFSTEAREQIGPLKIRRKPKPRSRDAKGSSLDQPAASSSVECEPSTETPGASASEPEAMTDGP